MLLIDRTYEVITQESADHGEVADSGFITINEKITFRELVEAMRRHVHLSCYPASGAINEWLETEPEQDFSSGDYRVEAMHYSKDNPPNRAKYWRKAMLATGKLAA